MSTVAPTKEDMLNYAFLVSELYYSKNTGIFAWKKSKSGRVGGVGAIAGSINAHGYRVIKINGFLYLAHRLAWFYIHNEWPEDGIDHINHKKDDNRIVNLRKANQIENSKNRRMAKNNTTLITGVNWDKKREEWIASIGHKMKKICLGRHKNFFDACCARKSAEIKYGFHKNHCMEVI